jgi:hypothetical protein
MTSIEAGRLADRAAENAYLKLLSRLMMTVTAPLVGFLAWQVFTDVGQLKGEVARLDVGAARLDTRLGHAEGQIAGHTASIDGTREAGRGFQQDVIGELAGVRVELRGMRADINRLFDRADRARPTAASAE